MKRKYNTNDKEVRVIGKIIALLKSFSEEYENNW